MSLRVSLPQPHLQEQPKTGVGSAHWNCLILLLSGLTAHTHQEQISKVNNLLFKKTQKKTTSWSQRNLSHWQRISTEQKRCYFVPPMLNFAEAKWWTARALIKQNDVGEAMMSHQNFSDQSALGDLFSPFVNMEAVDGAVIQIVKRVF